ncbi:MAG: DUF402 domain-containing protein [Candidatus Caccosoma sp.]|nr:DUF402 domain-containing protein [Candidatus Caccosoma sp.]
MVGQEIVIVAFKHNGNVHRTWYQTYLIEENDEYIAVGSTHSYVFESDGRKWHAIEPAVSIFMKKKWFNVVCMIKTTGINYYVNIASPSIIEDNVIKYIDYDLDFKVDNNYYVKTLDEFEYKKHKKIFNYSDELDEVIKYNFKKVKELIEKKEFPFNHEVVDELYKKYLLQE